MCCPAPLACGNHSGEAERLSGIGLKLFGFIPESVFTFIPESCSASSRNTVRNHPGIPFTFPRIPQSSYLKPAALRQRLNGPIAHADSAISVSGGLGIVRDHEDGLSRSLIKIAQQT